MLPPPSITRAVRALAVCSLVALVAGIPAQASGPRLTPAAYRAKATAICNALNTFTPPASGTFAQKFTVLVGEAISARKELGNLRPPTSLALLHAKVIALEARDIDFFRSLLNQLRAGKIGTAQLIASFAQAPSGTDEDRIWKQLGVPACVEG